MSPTFIISATTLGDALRELYNHKIILSVLDDDLSQRALLEWRESIH